MRNHKLFAALMSVSSLFFFAGIASANPAFNDHHDAHMDRGHHERMIDQHKAHNYRCDCKGPACRCDDHMAPPPKPMAPPPAPNMAPPPKPMAPPPKPMANPPHGPNMAPPPMPKR